MREEAARQQDDALAADEFLGSADGIARCAVVVTRDDFQRPAIDAAALVDFLSRQLPALAIGLQERGNHFVAVDFADFDRALRRRGASQGRHRREDHRQSAQSHLVTLPNSRMG